MHFTVFTKKLKLKDGKLYKKKKIIREGWCVCWPVGKVRKDGGVFLQDDPREGGHSSQSAEQCLYVSCFAPTLKKRPGFDQLRALSEGALHW